jgi:hypothetical protein
MARGAEFKKEITKKILEFFPNSFLYNDGKEIRICGQENGEEIQVKVTLTAAKENVYSGQDNATPGVAAEINFEDNKPIEKKITQPTQEEKDNVKRLMETFGL